MIWAWGAQRNRDSYNCDSKRSPEQPALAKSEETRTQNEYADCNGFPERSSEVQ
jgi:hypothetical protein